MIVNAARCGFIRDRAVNYNADREKNDILYRSVASAVCNLRSSSSLGAKWREELDADYRRRGGKVKKSK